MNVLLAIAVCTGTSVIAADAISVSSPDRVVEFKLSTRDGKLHYEVLFRKQPIVEASPLVISIDGTEITSGATTGEAKHYEVNETYVWRGVHSRATNQCKGATIAINHLASGTGYHLEVRVFNDGVGFRHIVPGDEKTRIPDEATLFTLPQRSTIWYHDLEGHYEAEYQKQDLAEVPAGQWVAPPVTYKLPGTTGYASITEASLANYSGMALQSAGNRQLAVMLGHKHHVSYPFRLRYKEDIERLSKPAAVTGTITSPWRVVLIAPDLNGLVNSDIVHNLCPPPDPQLFPNGLNTSWIKPGRAVWKYLDGGASTFDEMKEFSRMAGELGFEYHVIEGFWSRWSDEQIKELVDYSRQRGVGLFLWRHSRQLRTPEARAEFFKKLHDLGVVGAKIDFFDHEHKEVIDLYTELLASAAKHQIMVNFHGSNKPTGEARTWPNELIREGVRGMEARRLLTRAQHNTTLPFTRYLAGHGDYTPVHLGERRGDTTWGHQIATAAVFNEPLLTYGAHPAKLLSNSALPMIKSIPAVWDETIVLPPSEIGEAAAFARRRGATWFLAILNGPRAKTVTVPLKFLGQGPYATQIVRDHPNEPAAAKLENTRAGPAESLTIELDSGGGFLARFTPE